MKWQLPDTSLFQRGIETHSHLHPVGRQYLGTCSCGFLWRAKVVCEWFPGTCRLVLHCDTCDLYCCRSTLLRDTQWAKATGTAVVVCPEAQNMQMGSVLSSCPALPSFIVAIWLFWESCSWGVLWSDRAWELLGWLAVKFTCSVPALIFPPFNNGCEYQANV